MKQHQTTWISRVALLGAALSFWFFGPLQTWAAEGEMIEEVIVTGSYIRGTPDDTALPVNGWRWGVRPACRQRR